MSSYCHKIRAILLYCLIAAAPLAGIEWTPSNLGLATQDLVIEGPLTGGLSGAQNFLVQWQEKRCVLRILDPHLSEQSRIKEIQAALAAARTGVGPDIYAQGEASSWILMSYIEGGVLGTVDYAELPKLISTLRKLHASQESFPTGETVIQKIRRQLTGALEKGIPLPQPSTSLALAWLDAVESRFVHYQLVPCHQDLSPLNILRSQQGYKVVDWTDAGMSYELGDLAYFLLNNRIPRSLNAEALSLYYSREPSSTELEDLDQMQAMSALRMFASNFPAYTSPISDETKRRKEADEYETRLWDAALPDLEHFFAMHARGELSGTEPVIQLALSALRYSLERCQIKQEPSI